MTENISVKDDLVHELVRNYTEKVFYFCLKKTGSDHEAEDLTSDILLNIIDALDKGIVPEHFSAWIWKIARNRYSVWADKKHRQSESIAEEDIGSYEIVAQTTNAEEMLIREEQLSLLRRELSFISADYRNVIVAYYIKSRKVREIARSLGLPEGTVMSKLSRARKILKEGMNMAREFGKRSYDPEMISFCASGNQPSGLPWSAIQRKIPVNILCEAHNNPCTAEELAMEIGIAVPYMEEEIALLTDAELLKKLDNGKYLTNFFISPKECQNEIYEISCAFAEQHYTEIWQLAAKVLEKTRALGITTDSYSEADAQMFFAFCLEQMLEASPFSGNIYSKFQRADGGNWGVIGFERGRECRLPSSFFNNNGNGRGWSGYQATQEDRVFGKRSYITDVPDSFLSVTLKAVAEGADPSDFSGAEKENLQRLINGGFCVVRDNGTVAVNAILFKGEASEQLNAYIYALPEYCAQKENMHQHIEKVKEIVARYGNPYLKEDFDYYVAMSVELRPIFARLWKDRGLYTGESAQFCAFYY